jgi:hypothetical protein
MPITTPRIKVDAVAARDAEVVLHGDSYAEAYKRALRIKSSRGLTYVHPFDDPEVIAGQGTVGMEILRQHPRPIDAIFVPVGGGGLISGIAAYVKAINPKVRIVGVEPVDADAMTRSLKAGRRVKLDQVGLFADGVAVREPGAWTFPIVQQSRSNRVRQGSAVWQPSWRFGIFNRNPPCEWVSIGPDYFAICTSSTSKVTAVLGGITPGIPLAPQPSSEGTIMVRVPPSFMPTIPSSYPLIIWPLPKVLLSGWPLSTEESIFFPLALFTQSQTV